MPKASDNIKIYRNPNGPVVSTVNRRVLEQDGLTFKDIDGTGTVVSVRRDDIAVWYTIRTTPQLMRYIVEKGSIAIDGISLTVAAVETDRFSVSIIPHTVQETPLGEKQPGATVNLENDIIGKYVEKLMQKDGDMTPEFLAQNGF